MRRYMQISGAVVATLALVLATAGTSQGAFDKAELKCRKGIAKNFGKALATAQKVTARCHKGRNNGKVGPLVDCNDLAQADTKNKFAKAQAKIASQVVKCTDSGIDDDIRRLFVSCPEPCNTDLGLTNPLTTFAEVGTCLSCYAGDIAERLSAANQGSPAGVPMASKDDQKCHQTIGKRYGKLLKTILKERTKCQNAEDKAGAMTVAETGCATVDPKGKIAKAQLKATADMNKSCANATLANLDSCDATNVANLAACLDTESNDRGNEAMPAHYELAATVCPVQINSTIMSGDTTALGGAGLTPTRSFLEIGWTGIAHKADVPDNYVVGSSLSCPATPPCGDCTITGLAASAPQYADFTRCSNDLSIPCTTPFAADPLCGGNQCSYVVGPPLPTQTGNNPTCATNALAVDVTGTANPELGTGLLTLDLRTKVFLGISLTQPCPICVGDTTAKDGVRDGTCVGGARDSLSCDVSGFHPTFAAAADDEGVTLDCPPDPLSNITGTGLILPLALTTGSTSLAASNACDSPLGAFSCFCGVCSGNTAFPCRDDGECAAISAGTCTSQGGGVSRKPNDCDAFACTDLGDDKGECTTGPDEKFCSGELDAKGRGYLGCLSNADCDSASAASLCGDGSPGSCGTCTVDERRRCFLDPIVDQGVPDVNNPLLVSTFCLPPTNSLSLNGVTGTPGPIRLAIDMLTELIF